MIISGLKLYAYHGVREREKENGQFFMLDIVIYCDLLPAGTSDELFDTVSYSDVVKTVSKCFTERSFDLIEAAAQHVCDVLFATYDKINSIDITLKKPDAPIDAVFDHVAVRLLRDRIL